MGREDFSFLCYIFLFEFNSKRYHADYRKLFVSTWSFWTIRIIETFISKSLNNVKKKKKEEEKDEIIDDEFI